VVKERSVKKLLTIPEVAELFSCSDTNVYELMNEGRLTYVNVGLRKGRRVHPDDLERFLNESRVVGKQLPVPYKLKYLRLS
jgi:excisionase family DNA binding protein